MSIRIQSVAGDMTFNSSAGEIAGCNSAGVGLACDGDGIGINDDEVTGACDLTSEMTFEVIAGDTVWIRVGGFGTSSGTGVVTLIQVP